MQQEVVCQICHQILAVPFTFQCCYTSVCQACLKQTSYKEPKTSEKSHSFCPFCYKEINDLSLPFMNKFLGEYIEAIKLEKENNCDCCEKSIKYNDTIICSDCGNKVFCSDCCTILHSVGKYQLHERSCFLSSVNCQATSFTKGVTCYSHIKEKIEFICLKDFDVLCSKCCIGHKKNCKTSLIVPLREAYKELQEQITNKKDKLIHQQAMITKECENMERKLHILDINYNNNKEDIEEQFRSLREILNYKEKELLTTLENYWNKQRTLLKKEIQSIKENSGAIESLKDIISFSLSYQNLNFLESIKYLFYKIEHIMSNSKPKKDGFESSMTLHIPNIEDCKTFLYNLSFNEINESSVLPNNRPGSRRSYSIVMTEPSQNRTLTPVLKLAFPRNEFSKTDLELTERDTSRLDTSVEKAQGDLIFGEKETSCSAKTLSASSLHKSGFGRSSNLNKSFSLKSGERIAVPRTSLKIENRDIFDFDLSKVTGSSPIKSSRINTSYLEKDIAKTPQTKESDTPKRGFEFLSNRALSLSLKGQNSILKYDVKYFAELQKNPLLKRNFTETAQTSNSIFVAWTHVFEQINILYQVEYGVGTKVKGVEQFRTAFKGYGHTCIIADLMPRTSYRIRVRPILSKEGDETPLSNREKEGRAGEWSNTVNVYTRDSQKIDYSSMGLHAKMVIKGKETYVEFNKSGIITANDHYAYGKTAWEVELKQQSAHQTTDDSSSYIKVGVTNKVGKTINIFGSLINYGLQKESTKILVVLDLENRCLSVYSPTDPNGETINNLPEGPLYPAFQNKTNKNSNFVFRLYIKFDLPSDQVGKVMP